MSPGLLRSSVKIAGEPLEFDLPPLDLGQFRVGVADGGAQEFGARREALARDGRAGIGGVAGAGAEVLQALGATAAVGRHRAAAADRHGAAAGQAAEAVGGGCLRLARGFGGGSIEGCVDAHGTYPCSTSLRRALR